MKSATFGKYLVLGFLYVATFVGASLLGLFLQVAVVQAVGFVWILGLLPAGTGLAACIVARRYRVFEGFLFDTLDELPGSG